MTESFIERAKIIYTLVLAKELIAAELVAIFKDFVARAKSEYENVKAVEDIKDK